MIWIILIILLGIVYSLYAAWYHHGFELYDDPVGRACLKFWRAVGLFKP